MRGEKRAGAAAGDEPYAVARPLGRVCGPRVVEARLAHHPEADLSADRLRASDDVVSWGEKTVQKIVRIQERAQRLQVPLLYLVDAAGGRISEQIKIFPGRFHAGRIFYNEGAAVVTFGGSPSLLAENAPIITYAPWGSDLPSLADTAPRTPPPSSQP